MNPWSENVLSKLRHGDAGVVVQGGPGTGKTRLAVEVSCGLLDAGCRVLISCARQRAIDVIERSLPTEYRQWGLSLRQDHLDPGQALRTDIVQLLEVRDKVLETETRHAHHYQGLKSRIRRLETEEARHHGAIEDLTENLGEAVFRGALAGQLRTARWLTPAFDPCISLPEDSQESILHVLERLRSRELATSKPGVYLGMLPEREAVTACCQKVRVVPHTLADEDRVVLEAVRSTGMFAQRRVRVLARVLQGEQRTCLEGLPTVTSTSQPDFLGPISPLSARQFLKSLPRFSGLHELRRAARQHVLNLPDRPLSELVNETSALLRYFTSGGHRWGVRWISALSSARSIMECQVNGQRCNTLYGVQSLLTCLKARESLEALERALGKPLTADMCPGEEKEAQLRATLQIIARLPESLTSMQLPLPRWISVISAVSAKLAAEHCCAVLQRQLERAGNSAGDTLINSKLEEMSSALESGDELAYWRAHKALLSEQKLRDTSLTTILEETGCAPQLLSLALFVARNPLDPRWDSRLMALPWAWATLLRRHRYQELYRKRRNARVELGKARNELAHLSETHGAQVRNEMLAGFINADARKAMIAWKQNRDRLGRGTGDHAPIYRAEARSLQTRVFSRAPLVMATAESLLETCHFTHPLFDVLIIDEATQLSLQNVPLLNLAAQVVVIGDDEQTTATHIGDLPGYADFLRRQHLRDSELSSAYHPAANLFDLCELAFGARVRLRDHFRCPQAIVNFVNDIAYRDQPLRSMTPKEDPVLVPVCSEHVRSGLNPEQGLWTEDDRVNRAEAEAMIGRLSVLLHNDDYRGCTFGLISLYGVAQAELLEDLLHRRFDASTREKHRLTAGTAAQFQGDSRDVILCSLGVAKRRRLRAITGRADRQRFNVAITRTKRQFWLFHSLAANELPRQCLRRHLLEWALGEVGCEGHTKYIPSYRDGACDV